MCHLVTIKERNVLYLFQAYLRDTHDFLYFWVMVPVTIRYKSSEVLRDVQTEPCVLTDIQTDITSITTWSPLYPRFLGDPSRKKNPYSTPFWVFSYYIYFHCS